MRVLAVMFMMLIAGSAYANPDSVEPSYPFDKISHPLVDGLVLHGWSDGSHDAPKWIDERHLSMQLSIVQGIIAITAGDTHRITDARYRTISSMAVSNEGPTLPLADIHTPPSPWVSLPIDHGGTRVSLADISDQGSVHLTADAAIATLNLTHEQIVQAAVAEAAKYHPDTTNWREAAERCAQFSSACYAYIEKIELELAISGAAPVRLSFDYIPGC